MWVTLNEPFVTAIQGYGNGVFAPGRANDMRRTPYQVAHNQLLAHSRAYNVYQREFKPEQKGSLST